MAEKYITEEQRAKCRKVADAFAELYELTDVMVADAGRFGFVRLQWFSEGEGFDSAMAFSDSLELFEELWRIWIFPEQAFRGRNRASPVWKMCVMYCSSAFCLTQ